MSNRIAATVLDAILISTVQYDGGDCQTVVFGGPLDGQGQGWVDRQQAEAGHEQWVARAREAGPASAVEVALVVELRRVRAQHDAAR